MEFIKNKMYVVTTKSGQIFCSMYRFSCSYTNSYQFKKGSLPKDKLVSAILLEDYNRELCAKNNNKKICVRCGGTGQYGKHGNCYLCGGIGVRE